MDELQSKTAEAYFQASQRRIGALFHDNSILSVQCSFLTGVYLMSTMRIMAAWKSFVQAGNQCLAYLATKRLLNVHPKVVSSADEMEVTCTASSQSLTLRVIEDSLYWSCLKSET